MNYFYLLLTHVATFGLGAYWHYWKTRIETRATIDETRKNIPLIKNDEFIEYLEDFQSDIKREYFKNLYELCNHVDWKSYRESDSHLVQEILNMNQQLKSYKTYLDIKNKFEKLRSKFITIHENEKTKAVGIEKLKIIQNYFTNEIFLEIKNGEILNERNDSTDFKYLLVERSELADEYTQKLDEKYKSIYDQKFQTLIKELKKLS